MVTRKHPGTARKSLLQASKNKSKIERSRKKGCQWRAQPFCGSTTTPQFIPHLMNIPSQLIEVIDIALAGYRKENEAFIISIQHKAAEILQIINRNMVQECKAENGALSIMIGGEENDFEVVKPVLQSYGKAIELIGPSGSGQIAKMINQICIAGLVQGLSEAMAFGKKAKVDMEKVLSVISKGAAQSWQMENRYRTMIDGKFDYGFAVDWMRKDLSICFNEAKKNGASLPITEIVDKYYEEVQKNGGNRLDTSSLMTLVDK